MMGTAWQTANDRKKSKIAAISIRDEENVLLTGTAEARKTARQFEHPQDAIVSLRHPIRHVASNQILHTAMEKQMSWSSPNPRFPWNASSPPLAKIGTSLLSSVSAFDCAKYETQLWTHKYAPKAAEEVLQLGREPQMLRDWLRHLTITAVDTGKPPKDTPKSKNKRDKKRKNRQKADKLDGFIVSSEEEASEMDNLSGSDDELSGGVTTSAQRTVVRSGDMAAAEKVQMTNAILLSGPAGCGKTASVYAVAKELGFEVFEINPGSRRSARDMLERVGDMTQNHLVHLLNVSENLAESAKDDGKQNKLMSFFKGPSKPKQPDTQPEPSPKLEADPKRPRQQKQSLILLEEADLLFEEDRQFWTGVLTLIAQSRRPIIITCNDESLIPTQEISLHAILRYQKPPQDFSVDYLLLIAASEGHILKREAVTRLYQGSGMDLRRSLMDLNFWCQMGVGSKKAGLDWLLPAWPPASNVDYNGDRVRVLSLNTYERFMGWFNRDLLLSRDSLEKEAEINRNTFHWWGLGLQESEDMGGRSEVELMPPTQFQSSSKTAQLEMLCREADYYDMRSSLDILCSSCSIDMNNVSGIHTFADTPANINQDGIDISAPPLPEGHRSNYLDTYPLLQSDLRIEHSSLSEAVSTTFDALLSQTFRPTTNTDLESSYANRIVSKIVRSGNPQQTPPSTLPQFQRIFEPIMRANYSMPTPTARHAPSFENGLAAITEDLAPYIRGIMVFDGRLHQYRQKLYELTAQQQRGEKRSRTTRASRAALEGGDKASTRKERWFANDMPYYQVQATAGPDWQHVLYQMGHFHVHPMIEPTAESNEPVSINQIIENVE
jgi:DNA polymerase III delta prime subunit